MSVIPKDKRMEMVLEAYNIGRFKSKTACVKAYSVLLGTLINRLNRTKPRRELLSNSRKLSDLDEETLKEWIIDMYERGLGLGIPRIQYLA
jgi:hypothetical protein